MKVVLVTSIEWPDLFPGDHPFLDALRDAGFDATVALWDDPRVDWKGAGAIVIRSVWDYTLRRSEFLSWIDNASSNATMLNPPRVLRWNSHKGYLRDLERAGIDVVPTEWVEAGSSSDLANILERRGWQDAVVKPAVSAGARRTIRTSIDAAGPGQDHLGALLAGEDVMIQPYIPETEEVGERALVFFGGSFSHAVRKEPALAGRPYSSQEVTAVEPDPREMVLAEAVLRCIPEPLLYARVDVVVDAGVARLMELEVIEPQLYFDTAPGSAEQMVRVLREMLDG